MSSPGIGHQHPGFLLSCLSFFILETQESTADEPGEPTHESILDVEEVNERCEREDYVSSGGSLHPMEISLC